MKSFLFLLALGLASSDKLDRSYLPPPGSKFSGGSPGSLQVPLEYPKETYSTTLRPLTSERSENRLVSPEDSQLTVGINRGTGLQNGAPVSSQDLIPVTPGSNAPFTYFQNSYKVPTTTTSYAYTQTTTYPPSEGFETTLSPVVPTGFPDSPFKDIQQQAGINYPLNQGQNSPGYIQPGFVTGINLNGIPSGFGFQPQIPSGQAVIHGPTGLQQHPHNFNQYQQGLPSSTVSPIHAISAQSPGFTRSPYNHNQSLTQHLGVQPPKQLIGLPGIPSAGAPEVIPYYQPGLQQFPQNPSQFIGQQNSFPSTIGPQNIPSNQPGSLLFEGYPYLQGNITPGSNIIQQQSQLPTQHTGQQSVFPTKVGPQRIPSNSNQYGYSDIQGTIVPGSSIPQQFDGTFSSVSPQNFQVNQPEQPQFGGNLNNNKGTIAPSQLAPGPQGIPSQKPGAKQYGGDLDTIQGITLGSNISKSNSLLQQGQPGSSNQQQQSYNQNQYQGNNVVPQIPSSTMRPTDSQNIYRPDSTATSSIIPPGYYNQSPYPITTPTIPIYRTTLENVPSSVYPSFMNEGLGFPLRPERPQAESDRNAIILDYKNILTPEGFEYSFDTSNGIHADENGTAIDGVKAQGSYSYTGDDGKLYKVVYSADENGFRPQGDHLPTPPPIPKAIQGVIEQAAKDKDAGITDDGSYNDAKYGHKKYQGVRSRYRPSTQDRIITNGADIPNYYETRYPEDENRKTGSQTTKKPISASGNAEDMSNEYDDEINNSDRTIFNEGAVTKRPNQVPIRRPLEKQQEQDKYKYAEDEKNKMHEKKKPAGSKIENTIPFDSNNNNFQRRRPTKPGRKQNIKVNKDMIIGSQDIEEVFIDESQENGVEQDLALNINRPSSTQKPIKSGTKYVDSESEIQNLPDESIVSGKPKDAKRPGYSNTNNGEESNSFDQEFEKDNTSNEPSQSDYYEDYRKAGLTQSGIPEDNERPGSSSNTRYTESVRPGRPGIHVTHDKVFEDDSKDMQRGPPTSGKNGQTSNNQHSSSIDIRYPQQIEQETGYQYNPPQNKFNQGESNRFPARFPEIKQASSTKRPSMQHGLAGKKTTTIQPFMTPNIYADDDDGSDEDTSDEYPSKESVKATGTTSAPTSQTDYEDFETDQQIGDDLISPSKTGKTVSSTTRQPYYEQQTTIRPNVQYTPADKDGGTQKDTLRPVQRIENQNQGVNKNRRPGQRIGSTRKPGFPSVSSTTPMSYYTKETTQSQFPTTYETDASVTSNLDTTGKPAYRKPGRPIVSGRPSSRPDSIYTDRTIVPSSTTLRPVPSKLPGRTTSAPMNEYSDETGMPLSTTKKPVLYAVTRPASGYVDRTIKPDRPTTISVYSDRNVTPGSITVRPVTSSRISGTPDTVYAQNLPSTTYLPNDSFANATNRLDRLGQPGQAGQAGNLGQPDNGGDTIDKFRRPQLRRPGLTTDKFERPQPDQAGKSRYSGQNLNQFGRRQPGQAEQQLQSGQSPNQFIQPRPGQQEQQGQTIGQFGQPELGQLEQREHPGQTVDQYGQPRPGQQGQQGQPGQIIGLFGQPKLGQLGQRGQPEETVDQFGQPQSGQERQSGKTVDQFRRPQLGQPGVVEPSGQAGQPEQPGQPGSRVDQFKQRQPGQPWLLGQPGQPGTSVDQFGRPQPGQLGLSGQSGQPGPSVDQFGQPQPGQTGQPSFARQPGQLGQSVDQFGGPQPGQESHPGQQEQSGKSLDQYGRPQQEIGQQNQPDKLVQNVDQFGRLIPTSQAIGSTYRPDNSIPTQQPSTTYTDGIQSSQTPGLVTFKPTEPRFGGQGPSANGLIKGQVPTYLGPYVPTTTERLIGEDFSGPKQPQRFDPETGYHY